MRIVALRHLPTLANRKGLLQGCREYDIVAPDESMSVRIAQRRAEIAELGPFDRILVSDLRRTAQTAQVYGFTQTVVEPLLRELNFGRFEGQHRSKLDEHFGGRWQENPRTLLFGESMLDFEARIRLVLEKHTDVRSLLLFGHDAWIRGLISICRHGDIRGMNQVHCENNALIVLEIG